MSEHTDRDALPPIAVARASCRYYTQHGAGYEPSTWEVAAVLDGLEVQEKIAAALRAETRVMRQRITGLPREVRDERGAALDQAEQVHIRDTQIQSVRDVLDQDAPDPDVATRVRADTIRRALEGGATATPLPAAGVDPTTRDKD